MEIQIKDSVKKSLKRTLALKLYTSSVLLACCYIDGLGKKIYTGGPEYRFKKYIRLNMPKTHESLEKGSVKLGQKKDFCLDSLWQDVRCGLVHEIDPKSKAVILGRGKTIVHQNVSDGRYRGKDLVLSSPSFIKDFLESIDRI